MKLFCKFILLILLAGCSKGPANFENIDSTGAKLNDTTFKPTSATYTATDCYNKYLDSVNTFLGNYYREDDSVNSSQGPRLVNKMGELFSAWTDCLMGAGTYLSYPLVFYGGDNMPTSPLVPTQLMVHLMASDSVSVKNYIASVNGLSSSPNYLEQLNEVVTHVYDSLGAYTFLHMNPTTKYNIFRFCAEHLGYGDMFLSPPGGINPYLTMGYLYSIAAGAQIPKGVAEEYMTRPVDPTIITEFPVAPGDPLPDTYLEVWYGFLILIKN